MSLPPTKQLFDAQEFERMGEYGILGEDDRLELIEGELVHMAPIGSEHAGHVKRIATLFHRRIGLEAIVSVQDPIRLGERSEPRPDVALLRYRSDFYTSSHPRASDIFLIIEVGEESVAYDRDVKLPLYARWRIPAVWLVNLPERQLEVYEEPGPEGYLSHHVADPDESLQAPSMDPVRLAVKDLLPHR